MRVAFFSTKPRDRGFLDAANADGRDRPVFREPLFLAEAGPLAAMVEGPMGGRIASPALDVDVASPLAVAPTTLANISAIGHGSPFPTTIGPDVRRR